MLPYVPVVIVLKEPIIGKAIEHNDSCVVISSRPFDEAVIALVDMSALFHPIRLIDYEGRRIPAGTLYAIRCSRKKIERLSDYIIIGEVLDRLYPVDLSPENLSDVSIPIRIDDVLTRADERYISRL